MPESLWPIALVQLLVYAGWIGVERICYLRAVRVRGIAARELVRLTFAFAPRYATLGIVVSFVLLPLFLVGFSGRDDPGTGWFIVLSLATLAIDVALTFVTPALAYSTRRTRYAISLGLRMLRSEWPSCAWYALLPPLAIAFIAQVLTQRGELSPGIALASAAITTLLNLWFKGAIAAFYLRRHEAGDDGAAFVPRSDLEPPSPDHPSSGMPG